MLNDLDMAKVLAEAIPHYRKPWQLLVSVCLTRMNRITKELSNLEQRYASMQSEMEFEASVYNDHEHTKRHLQFIGTEKTQNLSEEREKEVLDASRKLAEIEDKEEEWSNDLNKVLINSRNMQDEDLANRNLLNRKLDDILHCVIQDETLLLENSTLYPYTVLQAEETLKSASERLLDSYRLNENCLFFSNAPVGVLKLKFKEEEERGALYQGVKLFFMKAHLHSPLETSVEGVNWLTLGELGECSNEGYFNRVKTFVS